MPILAPKEAPFEDVERLGLVITETDHGLHTGILYLADGQARICHLAFHHMLRDEEVDPTYRWTDINLDIDNKIVLAGLVGMIANEQPKIPYGFNFDGIAFDPATGKLVQPPAGQGLTCATFILSVFRTFSIPILDEATWQPRESDAEWQGKIIDLLERHAAKDHVEAVKNDLNAARFRPDEVVGSATSDDRPVSMENAEALAEQIQRDLAAGEK